MTLYVLRHGDAAESTVPHDSDRPLTDQGQRQALVAGRFLRSLDPGISLILASPLLRAQQTASAVSHEIGNTPVSISEHLGPSSDPHGAIEQLASLSDQHVLLVGHEPHLSKMISVLISGSEAPCVEMRKASLACLELPVPVQPQNGLLKWLMTTRQMESAVIYSGSA